MLPTETAPPGFPEAVAQLEAMQPRQRVICLHAGLVMLRHDIAPDLATLPDLFPDFRWPRPARQLLWDDPDSLVSTYVRRKRPRLLESHANRMAKEAVRASYMLFGDSLMHHVVIPGTVFAALQVVHSLGETIRARGQQVDIVPPAFIFSRGNAANFPEPDSMPARSLGTTGEQLQPIVKTMLAQWWTLCMKKLPVRDATTAHLTWWGTPQETCGCVEQKAQRNCRWCTGSGVPRADYQLETRTNLADPVRNAPVPPPV